ncbi:MAG: M1 family aminopeptidase [Crocinitomicaceae bacterium]
MEWIHIDSATFLEKFQLPVGFLENEEKGFHDYAQAVEVLDWFVKKITPYPFEKLANVQSKTIFGGMENAGCIFYFENSVTGKRNHEDLLAHEIAHQWFGNSASEKDWQHIWLSEGFATYLTDLYILEKYGTVEFEKRMQQERNKVISFYKKSPSPIVNTTSDLMSMLNANSYQKGAWVLHMLREKVGSVIFWEILQNYYNRFAYSNADTEDFFQVVEEVSGKKMDQFKKQWLHSAQIPELKITTKIKGKSFEIIVEQLQNELFHFDLDIGIIGKEDAEVFSISNIEKKVTTLTYKTKFKILKLDFDPNMKLLFLKQ